MFYKIFWGLLLLFYIYDISFLTIFLYYFRYQNELPKKIKSRGKDAHLTHEEMVQTIKWKLAVSKNNIIINDIVELIISNTTILLYNVKF